MPDTGQTNDARLKRPYADEPQETVYVVAQEGLQLHGDRNLFQAIAVLAFAAVGATIGYFVTNNRPDLAALAGGVLGMIAGAFLSGFVLMFLPPPTTTTTLADLRRKYRRLKRRLFVSAAMFLVCMLAMQPIIRRFGHDDSLFAWGMCLGWLAATLGLCFSMKVCVFHLREWKCPRCGERFGGLRSACQQCGLSMKDTAEVDTNRGDEPLEAVGLDAGKDVGEP